MKKYRVAVEDGLTNIEEMLKDEGYEVVDLEEAGPYADAIVITGLDEDIAGYAETISKGIVVDASGRQPEEILYDLEKHFRLQEDEE